MNKRIEKIIKDIYNATYKKIFTSKRLKEIALGNSKNIERVISVLEKSDEYKKFAKDFSIKLTRLGMQHERGQWKKYFELARKKHYVVLPKTFENFEKQVLKESIKKNFKMIKTIPSSIMKMYEQEFTKKLIQQVAENKISRGSFERELKKHSVTNSKVIARTETAKLQTAISESRALKIGSVAYEWLSSNDKRTRPSHKEMNGVIVFWRPDNQKPLLDNMRGNAGEFPNCRCATLPIVDEDDLTKSTYKVYDYRKDKIISMNKIKLLEKLQKGEL